MFEDVGDDDAVVIVVWNGGECILDAAVPQSIKVRARVLGSFLDDLHAVYLSWLSSLDGGTETASTTSNVKNPARGDGDAV